MIKTKQLALCVTAISLCALAACGDDDSTSSTGSTTANNVLPSAKMETTSYTVIKPCDGNALSAKTAEEDSGESAFFIVDSDGSAITDIEVMSYCQINTILYETRNDTLFITGKYEVPIDSTLLAEDTPRVEGFQTHCSCSYELELSIPPEFVGTKYVKASAETYPIIYVQK